jgi:hypothetical protein
MLDQVKEVTVYLSALLLGLGVFFVAHLGYGLIRHHCARRPERVRLALLERFHNRSLIVTGILGAASMYPVGQYTNLIYWYATFCGLALANVCSPLWADDMLAFSKIPLNKEV